VRQRAALYDNQLWPTVKGVIQVPYMMDPYISDLTKQIWLRNMERWSTLTGGRLSFFPISDKSQAPNGHWLALRADRGHIGQCGLGTGAPTGCKLRDSQVLGIGFLNGVTTTVFADRGANLGTLDDLEGNDVNKKLWDQDKITPPNEPGTKTPLRIASIERQQDGTEKIITWYESDPTPTKAGTTYKIWRSKGHYPELADSGAPVAVTLPSGLDSVFKGKHVGSTLRAVGVRGDTVYSYWNIDADLYVARGSSTKLDSVDGLRSVKIPAGKTVDDLIDVAFDDSGNLQSWFVGSYDFSYADDIPVPASVIRYQGTYRDLDGASDDPGTGSGISKQSSGRTALHELGHALGFEHEHQRADRNENIIVSADAIESDEGNYGLASPTIHSPYDLASVMHYGNGNVSRLDGSDISASQRLSWHDVAGLLEAYKLAPLTVEEAWAASDASDRALGYSPLTDMADRDIIAGDFNRSGVFYSYYAYDGQQKVASGNEWDLDATGKADFLAPAKIEGGAATLRGVAFSRKQFFVYGWFEGPKTAACPSALYRTNGSATDFNSKIFVPTCVEVADSSHDADDLVEVALDLYKGAERVYALYDDGTISVGTLADLAHFKAPFAYTLPGGIRIRNVRSFSVLNGVAMFHARGYALTRDLDFATTANFVPLIPIKDIPIKDLPGPIKELPPGLFHEQTKP
jgi:hypothetical protein